MCRRLLALAALLLAAASASAEPLPWSYFVRVHAPDGYDGILFATEVMPPATEGGPEVPYSFIWDTGPGNYGMVRIDSVTPTGTDTLFSFGPGFAEQVATLPSGKSFSPAVFQLSWGLTAGTESTTGQTTGSLSASGLFSSGTGNYMIDLDHSETVTLGGRRAVVQFVGVNSESGARIDMVVSPTDAPAAPEPGTVVLAGVAIAGGVGAWWRRKK